MRGISSQTIGRIFELYFKGYARDVIARKAGVSTGTISNVIDMLPESIDELRALSFELRKSGKSPHEALKGAKLLSKLDGLGIELDQLSSFIRMVKKLSKGTEYQPEQLVEWGTKLSDLEEKSGKSYTEAIQEHETATAQTRRLEEKDRKLETQIAEKERERKRKLRQNRITDKDIGNIKELRQSFRRYGINLNDAENLKKYLQNMQEIGGDPKKFVEYTRKHGSLRGRITHLENQKQQKTLELDKVKGTLKTSMDALTSVRTQIEELNQKEGMKRQSILTLSKKEDQLKERVEAESLKLAYTLRVRADAEEIRKATDENRKELNQLNSKIDTRKGKLVELESEIQRTLNIKNYAVELNGAISTQEQKKISLEQHNANLDEESEKKRDKLALADTIYDFLRRRPDYDFNRFHSMVEDLRKAREDRSSPLRSLIPRIEERIRMKALEAFEGDIISKVAYNETWKIKEKYRKGNIEKDETIRKLREEEAKKDSKLKILEAIEVNFEGKPTTLEDLRKFMLSLLQEEINRRADEKYNRLAALTHGTLDFIYKKLEGR